MTALHPTEVKYSRLQRGAKKRCSGHFVHSRQADIYAVASPECAASGVDLIQYASFSSPSSCMFVS